MRVLKRYECIGGPLCGQKPEAGGKVLYVEDADGRNHFYRLCVCVMEDYPTGRRKKATYWHYVGTRMRECGSPTLIPHRRKFK